MDGHRIQPTVATSSISAKCALAEFRRCGTLAELANVKNRWKPRLLPGKDTAAVRDAFMERQHALKHAEQEDSAPDPEQGQS